MSDTIERADVCIAACSDLFRDDANHFASPMALIPMLGARLAALTHTPDLILSDGEATLLGTVPGMGETARFAEGWLPYAKVFDHLERGRRHVVMGASQIDRHGNQNISSIGPFERPTRQLLGVRGAPGNTVSHRTSYWVPRQSARVFVERVDVISGVGPLAAREAGPAASRFNDIHRIVTNLGVFDIGGAESSVRLISIHPGVTVDEVQAASSFAIEVAAGLVETRLPDAEELSILNTVLDPKRTREREVPKA